MGENLEHVAGLRVLHVLHGFRVGDDPHHRLAKLFSGGKQGQLVPVGFAHLPPVDAGYGGHLFPDDGLGDDQGFAEDAVETLGDVPGHFEVLLLVPAHRHLVGIVDENVGRHQHRIGEQAVVDLLIPAPGVLEGVRPFQQAHGRDATEHPGQFGDLGDVGLAKEGMAFEIHAQGGEGGHQLIGLLAHHLRIANRGQRMEVGDEIKGFPRLLQGQGRLDHAQVIAQMRLSGGLDAGQGASHGGHGEKAIAQGKKVAASPPGKPAREREKFQHSA